MSLLTFLLIGPLAPSAYLDPGSGSMFIQILVAAFLGAGVLISASWSRIKNWLGIKSKSEDDEETDVDDNAK